MDTLLVALIKKKLQKPYQMTMTQFSVCRIGEKDLSVLLDFLFHRIRANENINMQNDGKFHGLLEYAISFLKRSIYGKDFLK